MKKMINIKFALLAVFAGLLLTASAQAANYTVNTNLDNGTGGCDAAECTLREAIAAANATAEGDVINFDPTVFNTPQTITLNGTQLTITNNSGALTINGTGADQLAISGNNVSTVLRNDNITANVVINAVTITRGRGGFGGGIANSVGGNLTLNNSVISFNAATNTGGGFNTDGTLTLNNSTVSNNSASVSGGGISNGGTVSNGGGVTLNNSTVSNNTAANGGGIDNGTFNNGSRVTLNSSTLSNNSASTSGGGIRNNMTSSITTLNNSIIANSTSGGDCSRVSGTINASYSLIEQNLTCVNGTNSNNLTSDPNLGPLQNNGGATFTHALLTGSIAIDAGNSTLTTDQRGSMRPVDDPNSPNGAGNLADIGAFEVQAPTAASVSISGRVLVAGGRGLSNALIYLTDQSGETRIARTSAFGYYHFDDLAAGQTVIMSVVSKHYQFTPQVVNVTENLSELNFVNQPSNFQIESVKPKVKQ